MTDLWCRQEGVTQAKQSLDFPSAEFEEPLGLLPGCQSWQSSQLTLAAPISETPESSPFPKETLKGSRVKQAHYTKGTGKKNMKASCRR